ncbi:10648_t:CDS:2, partial [Dentiscutata erythropus]
VVVVGRFRTLWNIICGFTWFLVVVVSGRFRTLLVGLRGFWNIFTWFLVVVMGGFRTLLNIIGGFSLFLVDLGCRFWYRRFIGGKPQKLAGQRFWWKEGEGG